VEQRCTCGAVLPEGARFCHKCGKPQYEEDIARLAAEEKPAPAPVSSPVALPPVISFRNARAVTVSVVAAVAAFVGFFAAALIFAPLWPLILLAAGFFAAAIYRSQSAEPLTAVGGARLGWMTGLWFFIVIVLIAMFATVFLATPAGAEAFQQMQNMPQFAQAKVENPRELQKMILMGMIPGFFVFTLLPGLGGILGARFWTKRRHSS
jgi:hypothetical protein